jgi:hypothetical protein
MNANSLRHPLRRADRGLTLGRALINRDCFGNRQAPQKGYGCSGSSGNLPPPSPPAEKATAREDQAGKASADDGTRYCGWHIPAVRETRGNSGGKTCNNKQRKVCKLFELITAGDVQPGCAAALSKPSFALLPKDRVRGVLSPHLVVQVEC